MRTFCHSGFHYYSPHEDIRLMPQLTAHVSVVLNYLFRVMIAFLPSSTSSSLKRAKDVNDRGNSGSSPETGMMPRRYVSISSDPL